MSASANEGQRRENRSSENEEEEEEGVGEYGIGIAKRLSGDRASATSGFCGKEYATRGTVFTCVGDRFKRFEICQYRFDDDGSMKNETSEAKRSRFRMRDDYGSSSSADNITCEFSFMGDCLAVTDGVSLVVYHRVLMSVDEDEDDDVVVDRRRASRRGRNGNEYEWVETESIELSLFSSDDVSRCSSVSLAWSKRGDEIAVLSSSGTAVRVEHVWDEDEKKLLRLVEKSSSFQVFDDNIKNDLMIEDIRMKYGNDMLAISIRESVYLQLTRNRSKIVRIKQPNSSTIIDFQIIDDCTNTTTCEKSRALIATLASDDCIRFWSVSSSAKHDKNSSNDGTTYSLKFCVTNDEYVSHDEEKNFISFDISNNFLIAVDASGYAIVWLISNMLGDTVPTITRVRRRFSLFNSRFHSPKMRTQLFARCSVISSQNRVSVDAIAYNKERIERSSGTSTTSRSISISSGHSTKLKKILTNIGGNKVATLDEGGKLKFWSCRDGRDNNTNNNSYYRNNSKNNGRTLIAIERIENVESFAWSQTYDAVMYVLNRDDELVRVSFSDDDRIKKMCTIAPASGHVGFANYDCINVLINKNDDVLILSPRISGSIYACSVNERCENGSSVAYFCNDDINVSAKKKPRGKYDSIKSTVSGSIITCHDGNSRTNFWRFNEERQSFDLFGNISCTMNCTVGISPCGSRACLLNSSSKTIEVLDASGERDGKLSTVATFTYGDDKSIESSATVEWLDIGGGTLAVFVAVGNLIMVIAPNSKLGDWTIAYSRTFEKTITHAAWKSNGDTIFVSFEDGEIILLVANEGTAGCLSFARAIAKFSAPLPCYHPAVLQDWIVRRKAHRARAAVRKVISHLEMIEDTNSNEIIPSTESARSTISCILELESSFTDDRPSTPRGKIVSPKGTSSSNVSIFSSNITNNVPSMVPEFDMGAFGGNFGGAPTSFQKDQTSPNMFAPENLSRKDSFVSEVSAASSDTLFRQNSNSFDETASSMSTRFPTAITGSSVSFTEREAETAADMFSRHAHYLGLNSHEAVEVLGCLDALRDSDVGIEATVDQAGRRLHALHRVRELEKRANIAIDVSGEELLWATHCETGDAIIDAILNRTDGKISGQSSSSSVTWRDLRVLGVPIWLRNDVTLKSLLDKAARDSFARTKDPESCALLFVSLGRTSVLAGLYKAKKDQKMFEFLSRDFKEKRHQEAALKNAYALLSKHRYELAATFFALAGQFEDAANICLKHLNDVSLSVAILRCFSPISSKINIDGSYNADSEVSKFIRAEIFEDREIDLKRSKDMSLDEKWRIAAFRWISGDFEKSVSLLSHLVCGVDESNFDKKISHESKSSALDLLSHITTKKRKHVRSDVLADCENVVKTKGASVSRAFELAGMPLAALERLTSLRKHNSSDNGVVVGVDDDDDDVPTFEEYNRSYSSSSLREKDSIDHAMELASTVVENFGLNDVVSPLRRSVSQLVSTGQFDFDGAFGWNDNVTIPEEDESSGSSSSMQANNDEITKKVQHNGSFSNNDEAQTHRSISHLHSLRQNGIKYVGKSTAARLAASALLVEFDDNGVFIAKDSDVPDDAQACTEMLSRAPFEVDNDLLEKNLTRRAFTLRNSNIKWVNENSNSMSTSKRDGLEEFFRSSVKRKIAETSVNNNRTKSEKSPTINYEDENNISSTTILKKSFELARLGGDGFVDICCNSREVSELAIASVRRGLVTVDLRELSKSGDGKRAAGVLSAAEAILRASSDHNKGGYSIASDFLSLTELFGFPKKQNLWEEASAPIEDWNVLYAPKYAKRSKRLSSSNTFIGDDREPSSPDASKRPETPSSAPKTPHLHDWGHELGVVIPAAAALSRQDSYSSSPGSSPRFSSGKSNDAPSDVSARVVCSHPSLPIFACGSANRGLQIWRFGFEETKKRLQLEIPKSNNRGGSGGNSDELKLLGSTALPVALAFNRSGERLACATTDGRVSLYDSSSSLQTLATRLCVFDSHSSSSSAFVTAKPVHLVFLSNLVCAIACETKTAGIMPRSLEKAGADGNGVLLWDAAQPNASRCGVVQDNYGVTNVVSLLSTTIDFDQNNNNNNSSSSHGGINAAGGISHLLALGNRNGEVCLHDLRKLSQRQLTSSPYPTTLIWRTSIKQSTSKITSLIHHHATSARSILCSGDDKGDIAVICQNSGKQLQLVEKAHEKHAFVAPRTGGATVSVALSKLISLPKGFLSCGGDGAVKLYRFD